MAREILLGKQAKGGAAVAPIHPDPDQQPDPDPHQVPVHPDPEPDPKDPPPIHPSHPGGDDDHPDGDGKPAGSRGTNSTPSYGIRKDENGDPTVVLDVD